MFVSVLGGDALRRGRRRARFRTCSTRCRGPPRRSRRRRRPRTPPRISAQRSGAEPVCTTAGPATHRIRLPASLHAPHLLGDLLDQQSLRLLARDVGRHELEGLSFGPRSRFLQRSDADAETGASRSHALLHIAHRDRARSYRTRRRCRSPSRYERRGSTCRRSAPPYRGSSTSRSRAGTSRRYRLPRLSHPRPSPRWLRAAGAGPGASRSCSSVSASTLIAGERCVVMLSRRCSARRSRTRAR